jgi:hypothetical protein
MAEKSWSLGRALRGMFVKPTIDETTWDDLEVALITADFGPDITEALLDELLEKVDRYRTTDPKDLQRMLRETLEERFAKFDTTLKLTERPAVVLVVGVNGVGKTTTIGKFAKFLQRYGRSVVVGAADTFRAAAVDQLATWGERVGVEVVRGTEGTDPASVAPVSVPPLRRVWSLRRSSRPDAGAQRSPTARPTMRNSQPRNPTSLTARPLARAGMPPRRNPMRKKVPTAARASRNGSRNNLIRNIVSS